MIRRFNYTGRIKITRQRVDISLHKDNEGKYFSAKINLAGLRLPSHAKLYIEANYKGIYQRYPYGTIEHIKEPSTTRLTELPDTELVFFDISIVDETGNIGLLLAKARGIPIKSDEDDSNRIPILPVNPVDLDKQFWKLSFDSSPDGGPVLEINKYIPDIFVMAKTDIKFIGLVYPTAVRQVLVKIIEEGDLNIDVESWQFNWLKFINVSLGIKYTPEFENDFESLTPEQDLWIDEVVNAFCIKYHLFDKFIAL